MMALAGEIIWRRIRRKVWASAVRVPSGGGGGRGERGDGREWWWWGTG